jgi:hypothetical protein
MVADLVYFARCVVHSDNTTYIVFSPFRPVAIAKLAKWRVVALSYCRRVSREARQTTRCCRSVGWFISQSFDLSRATT